VWNPSSLALALSPSPDFQSPHSPCRRPSASHRRSRGFLFRDLFLSLLLGAVSFPPRPRSFSEDEASSPPSLSPPSRVSFLQARRPPAPFGGCAFRVNREPPSSFLSDASPLTSRGALLHCRPGLLFLLYAPPFFFLRLFFRFEGFFVRERIARKRLSPPGYFCPLMNPKLPTEGPSDRRGSSSISPLGKNFSGIQLLSEGEHSW